LKILFFLLLCVELFTQLSQLHRKMLYLKLGSEMNYCSHGLQHTDILVFETKFNKLFFYLCSVFSIS